MIKRIDVETFIKPMGSGISRPALVQGDDFNEYILKNEKSDNNGTIQNFNCMFLNETLAYYIGKYLDVPMPEAAMAYVSNDFINQDPSIRFAYRFEEGNYFATQKIDDLENNLMENMNTLRNMGKSYANRTWNTFFKNINNKDKMVNIIAFDIFISNFDRYSNEGNILLSSANGRNVFAIDHGHAFHGPEMTSKKIDYMLNLFDNPDYSKIIASTIKSTTGRIFRSLCQHIDLTNQNINPFLEVVNKIENISEELIDEWLNNIPIEWFTDKDLQKSYYKHYLLKQKLYIRHIIDCMLRLDLFDNYLGGALIWETKVKSSTV